jgi:SAM-dependent methyltransferase
MFCNLSGAFVLAIAVHHVKLTPFSSNGRRLRLLVAICSHGQRNLQHLKRIISTYKELPLDVDVIVLSEAPKDLGPHVKVVLGLPSENPWSLPFGHKNIFAENADRYDLFAYSEDDVELTRSNLEAFLDLTPELESDEIAGFLHYEQDKAGKVWMVCAHRHFHWKADSVKRRGRHVVAEFTNEHSAFFLLTQDQLKRAIASGGFLRDPYEGKYDMLCTAATDPYTSCGFRKVICISALKGFLIHHLPDKYVSELDVPLSMFEEQVQALLDIKQDRLPASDLLQTQSRLPQFWWQKSYYEKPDSEVLKRVPGEAKTILSIGCGWGALEAELKKRGAKVTALPLDAVIGAVAANRGIEVLNGNWDECVKTLAGRRFDCVLVTNLLHLLPQPEALLAQSSHFVREGGTLVLSGPNFDHLPWRAKRAFGIGEYRKLQSFDQSGITVCGPKSLESCIGNAGLRVVAVSWFNHGPGRRGIDGTLFRFNSFTAKDWVLQAQRTASS